MCLCVSDCTHTYVIDCGLLENDEARLPQKPMLGFSARVAGG